MNRLFEWLFGLAILAALMEFVPNPQKAMETAALVVESPQFRIGN